MRVLPLLFCFAILQQLAFGQSLSVKGFVYKHDTQEGLPYVSIGILNTPKGTSTNLDGSFAMNASKDDTLVFSHIGYRAERVAVADLGAGVYLQQSAVGLKEVAVKSSGRLRSETLGNLRAKTFLLSQGANQYAMLLKTESGDGVLEKLYFHLQPSIYKDARSRAIIKVRVYRNDRGAPGQDLLTENLVWVIDKKEKKVRVDVEEFGILVPREGVFIGFDFLGTLDEKGAFTPYSRTERTVKFKVEFSEGEPAYKTYSKFYGTDWMPTSHRNRSGGTVAISAKFGAKLSH